LLAKWAAVSFDPPHYVYDQRAVTDALWDSGISVLEHDGYTVQFQDRSIQIVGILDAHIARPEAYSLLADLSPDRPTIALTHDPVWFGHLPVGPHLKLAGHTHGGQMRTASAIRIEGLALSQKGSRELVVRSLSMISLR